MAEHEPFRSDLPLYLTGDLDAEAITRLEAHLAGCASCRRELIAEQATLELLERAAAGDDPAVDLGGFFDERIAPALRPRRRWTPTLARAAVLLVAFGAGWFARRPEPAQPPEQEPRAVSIPTSVVREYRNSSGSSTALGQALVLYKKFAARKG